MIRLDPASRETRGYRHHADDPGSLSADSVRILFNDASGASWIGTDGGGLNRYDPAADAFEHVRQDPADFHSLSDDHVVSLFQDRGGVMWVGTYVGVNTWNPRDRDVRDRGAPEWRLQRARRTTMSPVLQRRRKARCGSVIRRRPESDEYEPPAQSMRCAIRRRTATSLGDDRVFSLATEGTNGLWIGTRSGGLNHLDPTSGHFRRFVHDAGDPAR